MGSHARLLSGHVEAWRAVDAVAVGERDGRQFERGGVRGQLLGQGSAGQEAEGGTGVELYVHIFVVSARIRRIARFSLEIRRESVRSVGYPWGIPRLRNCRSAELQN